MEVGCSVAVAVSDGAAEGTSVDRASSAVTRRISVARVGVLLGVRVAVGVLVEVGVEVAVAVGVGVVVGILVSVSFVRTAIVGYSVTSTHSPALDSRSAYY